MEQNYKETVQEQRDKSLVCTELNKLSYLEKGSGRWILAIKTLPFNVTGVKEQVHSPHWINIIMFFKPIRLFQSYPFK